MIRKPFKDWKPGGIKDMCEEEMRSLANDIEDLIPAPGTGMTMSHGDYVRWMVRTSMEKRGLYPKKNQ